MSNETKVVWLVGHNMAGYIGESVPYLTTSYDQAWDILQSDITETWSSLWDGLSELTKISDIMIQNGFDMVQELLDWCEQGNFVPTDSDLQCLQSIAQCESVKFSNMPLIPIQYLAYVDINGVMEAYWINDLSEDFDLNDPELEAKLEKLNEQC